MSGIEAVLLDAGGVLLLPHAKAILAALDRIGVAVDETLLERAHYRGMRGVDTHTGPGPRWTSYTVGYVRELGIDARADEASAAVMRAFDGMEWIVPIESSIGALPRLAAAGVKLAIVSNSDGTVERLLRDTRIAQVGSGLGAQMVTIIDSHLVKVEKPDPRIFEMALEAIGVPASRALHVGDSVRFDVVGARSAGVRPVHLDPFGFCPDDDHEHISSLEAVLQLF